MDEPPAYLTFWGKAQPFDGAASPWHPVAYHALDVAACVEAILHARPLALTKAANLLACSAADAMSLCTSLTALHDLGKFSKAFQAKCPQLWPPALGVCDPSRIVNSPHTVDGYELWRHKLAAKFAARLWRGATAHDLKPLLQAVFGHHGRPVPSHGRPVEEVFGTAGVDAADECASALIDFLMPAPVGGGADLESISFRASWWLAGLVTVADWIGSHQEWFPYHRPHYSVGDYWALAREGAAGAVRIAGLVAARPSTPKSFVQLTKITTPTPAQEWAGSVQLPDGPVLVILEDVTGSGKTEAAQMLVHRLVSEGRAAGAYWAMPTQATANAMYARQHEVIARLFDANGATRPSLVLAHGQARLHDVFRASVFASDTAVATREVAPNQLPDDLSSSYWCAAFLADDRRASLLADVGAGTVDQALLAALPSKFNTVRLFGLADKVMVVDEAHAYDAFTSTELRELLRFQAALGGHAVVLSATLTFEKRMELALVWRESATPSSPRSRHSVVPKLALEERRRIAYPLATVVSGDTSGLVEYPLPAAPWSHRRVDVRLVHAVDRAIDEMVEAVKMGAAVAWVRNTVGGCLRGVTSLRARGLDPQVFHARFAQCDRQTRERDVMNRFGRFASGDGRRGRILVATQVIEQSLDLDFDLIVSDLAPVDLLIQRAGRLWRHSERDISRPAGMKAELLVVSPEASEDVEGGWLKSLLPGTDLVYPNSAILWRTARALGLKGAIDTPSGCRELVEEVYCGIECPAGLVASTDRAAGTSSANAAVANYGTLRIVDGYNGDKTAWIDDMRMPTRLGEAQILLRLARVDQSGNLHPWARDAFPTWKAWALSELRVYQTRIPPGTEPPAELQARIATVKSTWGRFEQDIFLVPLVEQQRGEWQTTLRRAAGGRELRLSYSEGEGLRFD